MMNHIDTIQATAEAPPRPARLNPFVFPSDTSLRFLLLIVCVLGATLWVYYIAIWQSPGEVIASVNVVLSCQKSSGILPAMQEVLKQNGNINPKSEARFEAAQAAYAKCMAPLYLQQTSRMLGGVALLLVIAVSIYLILPAWKRWRKRLVPLPREDMPEVMAELIALCHEAGLKRQPQFLWNPLNLVSEGLAFGCLGRYTVALTGGLVKQAYADPAAFRAVIRHELAHLRNGDIDKTYFSVAIWRAFVITALAPFLGYIISRSFTNLTLTDLTFPLDIGLRMLALALLVLLTRNAVLRARELYADARASTWDGPAGSLARVLERLPHRRYGSRWKITQITQAHPEPRTRRAMLDDSSPLLQIGFWDALGAGIAAAIAFTGLDQFFASLLGSLQISYVPNVSAGLVFGGLAAGVVGAGLWRATCASLLQGKVPRGVSRLALGMMSGIILGRMVSLSSIGDYQISLNTLESSLAVWIVWSLILLLSLWLIMRWIRSVAAVWLQVTRTTSTLLWSARLGLIIAGGFWAICFGPLFFALSLLSSSANVGDGIGLLIDLLLASATALLQPFFVIGLFALWAFPFAARFWRRRAVASTQSAWIQQGSASGQVKTGEQGPVQFRRALLIAAVGALLFCGIMLAFHLWLDLTIPKSIRGTAGFKLALVFWVFTRAALVQGAIALITAAWTRRSNVLLALFAAFISGCVITIGFLVMNVLWGGGIDLNFTWIILSGMVIPGGLLAVLLAPVSALLAKWIGPALRAALGGALIYGGLILVITVSWDVMTLPSFVRIPLVSAELLLLIVVQMLVGTFVAGRSPRRGWLYGLLAAGITGFVSESLEVPLTTGGAITSSAQVGQILQAGAYLAITGMLLALPLVLIVSFAAWWIRRSRLRKNAVMPVPTTPPSLTR